MARMAAPESGARAGDRVARLLERRLEAGERFFAAEAVRIAELCRLLAGRFAAGGRLLAVGGSPQDWSDAHHVAVEFVHPVIVGKRALPALAVAPEHVRLLAGPDDLVVAFEPLTVAGEVFEPPSDDPFVRQEIGETTYHMLWELVHVFFEHLGRSDTGAGASAFLYPFLEQGEVSLDPIVEDVRRSVELKAADIAELRTQTLTENAAVLSAAAADIRRSLDEGGRVLAFGNGGSATDSMDVVADLRAAPQGWTPRPAVDLAADPAILSALANDVGAEVLFQRQVIAHGRPGDVALALSTSGSSTNIVEALAEAGRRRLVTVAMVGYDGGRIAAERLADHVVVSRSEHIPRIQEAQASAYHVLRELVELAG
jgi:D-sedoheptulose 7-phosphate isomerase